MSLSTAIRRTFDRFIGGRGEFSITVPVMDGALKPNDYLERIPSFAMVEDADNAARRQAPGPGRPPAILTPTPSRPMASASPVEAATQAIGASYAQWRLCAPPASRRSRRGPDDTSSPSCVVTALSASSTMANDGMRSR